MEGGDRSDGARSLIRTLLAATAVGVLAYAAFIAAGRAGRARRRRLDLGLPRNPPARRPDLLRRARRPSAASGRVWIAFGLGLLFWTAGDLYWTLAYTNVAKTPVPVPRRRRLPRRPAVLLRGDRAPDQAADRPLHRRQLARRGDRRPRRRGARHRPPGARAGRPDEGRRAGGADEPRLSARRHPARQLHPRRARRQRLPRRAARSWRSSRG